MNGSHCLGNRVFSSLIIETWRATGRSPECDQNIASKFCQLQWQPKVLDVVARKEYNTRQVLGTHNADNKDRNSGCWPFWTHNTCIHYTVKHLPICGVFF